MRQTSTTAHRIESSFAIHWSRTCQSHFLCVGCLVALSSGSAPAQESLAGKRVVVINDKAPLAVSGQAVSMAEECSVFSVNKVDGVWLWIKSEQAYLRRGDVVPFEDALCHYTRQLDANRTASNTGAAPRFGG